MKPQHGTMVRTGGEGVGGTVRTSCHQVVDHYHYGHQVVDHDLHCHKVVDRPTRLLSLCVLSKEFPHNSFSLIVLLKTLNYSGLPSHRRTCDKVPFTYEVT